MGFVLIFGSPVVGKMTVGYELAYLTAQDVAKKVVDVFGFEVM